MNLKSSRVVSVTKLPRVRAGTFVASMAAGLSAMGLGLSLSGCMTTGLKGFPNANTLPPLDLTRVPRDMTPFLDVTNGLDFMLPRGWKPDQPDAAVTRHIISKTGILAFRKEGVGVAHLWCHKYSAGGDFAMKSQQYLVRDISPSFEPVRVTSPKAQRGGDDPYYWRYKGIKISRGEKVAYTILTGHKTGGVFTSNCDYMLLGTSLNEERSDELYYDLYAVMQSMR